MKTLKIYLNEDGSIRDYTQDFVINQYSFQDSLINVYVPTSILDLRNTNTTIEDEDTGATITTINGTDVQMGLIYTNSNGTTRVGDGYLFNFVKSNIIVNNVNYTLFERLMPKEFSLYAGENNYALNVVNVRTINTTLNGETTTESFTTSLITSATYHLYITASANFDTTTEETTDLENLQAQVNGIADDLALKQDKEDSSINVYTDSTHTETTHNVVEGLNDLNTRVAANESDLTTLKPQVQTNTEDIATLKNQVICDAIYVGSITANTEPNATTLTNFVESEGFELKAGDVVIWIYQISGATDKTYKCMYGASGWSWFEIPPIENASNGTKGLVAGTWGVDNYDTLVDIVDGKIRAIFVKRYGNLGYYEISTITTILDAAITNIINGNASVGNATYATYDESERNNAVKTPIASKFTTPSQVASAIQDYALPKVFNDVYFFDFTNSELISDSSDLGLSDSLTLDLTNVETVQAVFTQAITNPYTISARNNFNAQIAVDATNLVNDIQLKMVIDLVDSHNTEKYLGGAIANIAHGTGTSIVNLNGYFFALQLGGEEIEVDSTYHYKITIGVENDTSNNGDIVLKNSSVMPLSSYVLSLPFGSIEFSEALKGEIFNLNATGVYEENEILDGENDPYTEKILYLSISDFDISAYSSGDSVATHIKATYTSATELSADTQIKASINGSDYKVYSPQCNDMVYGYFKPVQTSKTLSNGTYTYIFEFDATFNLTNGFYIDIPYGTIVRLTQTEYNALANAMPTPLLNEKLLYAISNNDSSNELLLNVYSATYSELATLKANNELVAGQYYRITDYITTVNGKVNNVSDLARATGNQFDLIIQAISTNKFSENATPILHSGDTYFASENLNAWKVWYCFDNDTNRFEWADSVNGKGVIYRLIDEFENDVPYDFKNIQFKRFAISAVADSRQSFMIGLKIGVNGQSANITSDTTTYDWCYTFSTSDLRDASLRANYVAGASFATSTMAKQNIIGQYLSDSPYYRGVQALNDFVIKSNNSIDNKFGDGSHSNTIYANGNDVMYNYFGGMFRQNVIALRNINHNDANECFERNVIGKDLTTENSFQWNIFGSHFINSVCISVKHSHFTLNSTVDSTKFANLMQCCEVGTILNCDFSGCTEMQEVKLYIMSSVTVLKRIRYSTIFKIINSTVDSNIMYSNISLIARSTIQCDLTVVNIEYINHCTITLSSIQYSKVLLQFTIINDSTITLRAVDTRILLQNDTSITLPQTTLVGGKIYDNVAHTILLFENKVFDDTTHTMTDVNLYSTDNGATWTEATSQSGGGGTPMFSDYDILTAINGKTLNGEAFKTFLNNLDANIDYTLEGEIVESAYVLGEDAVAFGLYSQKSGDDNDYSLDVYGQTVFTSGITASTFDNLTVECDELDYTDPLYMPSVQRYIAPLISVFDSGGNSTIIKFDWQDFIDCFE